MSVSQVGDFGGLSGMAPRIHKKLTQAEAGFPGRPKDQSFSLAAKNKGESRVFG